MTRKLFAPVNAVAKAMTFAASAESLGQQTRGCCVSHVSRLLQSDLSAMSGSNDLEELSSFSWHRRSASSTHL